MPNLSEVKTLIHTDKTRTVIQCIKVPMARVQLWVGRLTILNHQIEAVMIPLEIYKRSIRVLIEVKAIHWSREVVIINSGR